MGRALALGLAEAGSDVMVHYHRSAEAAEETANDIRALGRDAATTAADLSEPAAIDELFEALDRRFGRLDVLVNSAASFERLPIAEITAAEWDAVQAVNLRAPFLSSQRAAKRMRVSDRPGRSDRGVAGLIINLADQSGISTWKGFTWRSPLRKAITSVRRSMEKT